MDYAKLDDRRLANERERLLSRGKYRRVALLDEERIRRGHTLEDKDDYDRILRNHERKIATMHGKHGAAKSAMEEVKELQERSKIVAIAMGKADATGTFSPKRVTREKSNAEKVKAKATVSV